MKIASAIALSASVIFLVSACQTHDKAAEEACKDISCPGGTAAKVVAESFSSCDYNLDYSLGLDGEEMGAGAACISKGSCKYVCEVLECDGNWTVTGPDAAGSYAYECKECEPTCNDKVCGPDGCGGECNGGCGDGYQCPQALEGDVCCPASAPEDSCCREDNDCATEPKCAADPNDSSKAVVMVESCGDDSVCARHPDKSISPDCGDYKCDYLSDTPTCYESCTKTGGECAAGKVCVDNTCVEPLGKGVACSDDTDCNQDFGLECGSNGICCTQGSLCCDDSDKGCSAPTCNGSDLKENICGDNNLCVDVVKPCDGNLKCAGGSCPSKCGTGKGECMSGYACVTGTCLGKVDLGDICKTDEMCTEGVCDSDAKRCCIDNGKPCCNPDDKSACGEIVCEGNDVKETVCDKGTATCANTDFVNACTDTVCVDGVGCQKGCKEDSDCVGDKVCAGGCVAKVGLGGDCTKDKMCNEGICDPDTKICCSDIGACCTSDKHCEGKSTCSGGAQYNLLCNSATNKCDETPGSKKTNCKSGFECNTETGKCFTVCGDSDNSGCNDGYFCLDGKQCLEESTAAKGQTCKETSQCKSNLQCDSGYCCDDSYDGCCKTDGTCADPKTLNSSATSIKAKWMDWDFPGKDIEVKKGQWAIQAFEPKSTSGYLREAVLGLKHKTVQSSGAQMYIRLYVQQGGTTTFDFVAKSKTKVMPTSSPPVFNEFHKVTFKFEDSNVYIGTGKDYLLMLMSNSSTKPVIWYYGKEGSHNAFGNTGGTCVPDSFEAGCVKVIGTPPAECSFCSDEAPLCLKTTLIKAADIGCKDFYFTVKTVPAYCDSGNYTCCNTGSNVCD